MNFKKMALTLILCGSPLICARPTYIHSPEKYQACFDSDKPMVIMYTSPSCGPCKSMKPDFYKVARNHPDIEFHIIDVTKRSMRPFVQKLGIQGLPTLILSCNGKIIARARGGLSKKEIEQEIARFKQSLSKQSQKAKKNSVKQTK